MKISQKLILGFTTIAVLVAVLGSISLSQLYKIAKPLNRDIPKTIQEVKQTSHLDSIAQFIRYYNEVLTQSARNYAFTQKQKWKQRYADVQPKLDKIITEAIDKGNAVDKQFFSSVNHANLALADMEYKSIALVENNRAKQAIKLLESEEYWDQKKKYELGLKNYLSKRGLQYDQALLNSTEIIDSATNRTQELIKISTMIVFCFTVTTLTLAITIGIYISRSIASPLKRLQSAITKIGKGHLNTRIEVNSQDEIATLINTFNDMAEDLERTTTSVENLNREIAIRKEAENNMGILNENLEITVQKLKQSNHELEEVAYIASHDLKAPLRSVSTLTSWLAKDYADKLDQTGRDQMDLLISRVSRMYGLIDGILQYARLNNAKIEKQSVDLNKLLQETIEILSVPQNIQITLENQMPTVFCQPSHINQIFQNLLANAVKYMDKPQGKISIRCDEQNGSYKFSVADNGPGIEEKHFERIFKIFQTLSHKDKSDSTGIGLSVVKKLVELNNGKIWIESELGSGSTFFFTLPILNREYQNERIKASSTY